MVLYGQVYQGTWKGQRKWWTCVFIIVYCVHICIFVFVFWSVDAGTCTWRGNKAVNAVGSQTRPWAHLLPSRILHSNLQQGWRRLSNLLQVQTCVRHCWLFSAWLPDHHDSQNMQHSNIQLRSAAWSFYANVGGAITYSQVSGRHDWARQDYGSF